MSAFPRPIPELLAPAGSLEAVRAAVANGADAVYCGASQFNARDEGAQLTLDDLEQGCLIAHERGVRIYLTLNILVKPSELHQALRFLGECIDRGIDAAIVQDVGLVRLIQRVYPGFEIHGSTQMTVHDSSGARVMERLGVRRVVLARENTLEDIRAIRSAVPALGLESFVHGALCIAYSGQCYMSGMISERSANRGSCAQSCRKDYVLTDAATGVELDRGYLISAKDLGAWEHLVEIAEAGIGCLKIEGRKKKPEFVATVTRGYREFLARVATGTFVAPSFEEVQPLVQIFSRGFTGGMYGGREGRGYITRTQPDNRGVELGVVTGFADGELLVEVRAMIAERDGLGFEPPAGGHLESTGFTAGAVRVVASTGGLHRLAIRAPHRVAAGWRVIRSSQAALLDRARASFANVGRGTRRKRVPLAMRLFGSAGAPLKAIVRSGSDEVTILSETVLAPAASRSLEDAQLREHFGRLGETPFALAEIDRRGLPAGLFLPVRELNHIRQRAVDELVVRRDWEEDARVESREESIRGAIQTLTLGSAPRDAASAVSATSGSASTSAAARQGAGHSVGAVVAEVWRLSDADEAIDAGATEVVFDPFLRHPFPAVTQIRALFDRAREREVTVRLRLPSIVRPEDRKKLDKWLALGTPLLSGHLGLLAELAGVGRDVAADYAVNCFNQHTAAELRALGASHITASVELTADEIGAMVAPWSGRGFEVLVFGRPEGMILEHCVLSAAFDRTPTHCRDLCTRDHADTRLRDPAGYEFPVATDYACRNRLLHSRPVEGSEFLPRLWHSGIRRYRLVFNVSADPVAAIVAATRHALASLEAGRTPGREVREVVGGAFTRGHFARAV